MQLKNYFIFCLSLSVLVISRPSYCAKKGHTVITQKWINKKTGEGRTTEEVFHHGPVNLPSGKAHVQQIDESSGVAASAIVERDDLNSSGERTGFFALPFRKDSRYAQKSAYWPGAARSYQRYQPITEAAPSAAVVTAEPVPNDWQGERTFYSETDGFLGGSASSSTFQKKHASKSYGSVSTGDDLPRNHKAQLRRIAAIAITLCGSSLGMATLGGGILMMGSALQAMQTPLADEIICRNSPLDYHTYQTGSPVALIHTSSCEPCSLFQVSSYLATGYEGSVCYHSTQSCCTQWSRRLVSDDGWTLVSTTTTTYNDDTFHSPSSSYSSSYGRNDDDTFHYSSSPYSSHGFSNSYSQNGGVRHTCKQKIYNRKVTICPPEAARADYAVSFSYQDEQEEKTVTCPRRRSFTQSEFSHACTVQNELRSFVASHHEGAYTCYLKKQGREERNICNSLSDHRPWHHGQNLKFATGLLIAAIGPGVVFAAAVAGKNFY